MGRGRTRNDTLGKMGDETEPLCFGILQRTLWGSWDRDISRPVADGAGSWECVTVEGLLIVEWM